MKFILLIAIIAIIIVYFRKRKAKETLIENRPAADLEEMDSLLQANVTFYERLDASERELFQKRVRHFLATTKISPVGEVTITYLDKLYVAASAIIPIFYFTDWAYNNLDEVLIYPGTFTKEFDIEDEEKNVLGMVGDGAMHRMMILSLPSLRAGFERNGAGNTGIHEFVHLLDKADGATDGVPEYMIPKSIQTPWIRQMHKTIREIRNNDSDINPYSGTNEAEFFAVVSEYFFQKPQFLKAQHPEIFGILEEVYKSPKTTES